VGRGQAHEARSHPLTADCEVGVAKKKARRKAAVIAGAFAAAAAGAVAGAFAMREESATNAGCEITVPSAKPSQLPTSVSPTPVPPQPQSNRMVRGRIRVR